jgi:hypothetical protein
MVTLDGKAGENVLHRLRHANLEKIQQQFSEYPYRDLLKAIQVSVDWLETEQLRERYLEFAVFPEKTPIPEAALQTFWTPMGMDKYEVQDALKRFVDLSLMRREENCVSLHDLQYAYARRRTGAGSLAALTSASSVRTASTARMVGRVGLLTVTILNGCPGT